MIHVHFELMSYHLSSIIYLVITKDDVPTCTYFEVHLHRSCAKQINYSFINLGASNFINFPRNLKKRKSFASINKD